MKYKIRKDDKVIIISGKEKGKTGVVKKVFVEAGRVLVEGLNKVVCFNKKTKTGMSTKEAPIHISNVSHIDPVDGRPTRVKVLVEDGVKSIVSKRSGRKVR